jgi:hypothetical protein
MFSVSWFFLMILLLLSWHLSEDPNRVEGFWSMFVLILGSPIFILFAVVELLLSLE